MTASPICVAPHCDQAVAHGSFCARHLTASAAQRGGWLSAAKRRVFRSNGPAVELDASCISRRLWVGAKPPFDRPLPAFDTLVLCAQEIQPQVLAFEGTVIRVPLPDAELDSRKTKLALVAGKRVARDLVAGKTVLVTCQMGWNRSALVACLALGLCTRLSASELVELVRERRLPECLSNEHFVQILERYIGAGRRAPIAALAR